MRVISFPHARTHDHSGEHNRSHASVQMERRRTEKREISASRKCNRPSLSPTRLSSTSTFWMTAPTQLHGKRPPLSCCENYEQVVIARMIHCFAPGGESSLRGPPPRSASSECESWLKTCERLGLSLSTTCDLARLPKKSRCSLGD